MLAAIAVYIGLSLVTCRDVFNMDRMLHRRKYRRHDEFAAAAVVEKPPRTLKSPAGHR